ncbi:hypothetical protein PO909_029677 [Leuciscus waleckii]
MDSRGLSPTTWDREIFRGTRLVKFRGTRGGRRGGDTRGEHRQHSPVWSFSDHGPARFSPERLSSPVPVVPVPMVPTPVVPAPMVPVISVPVVQSSETPKRRRRRKASSTTVHVQAETIHIAFAQSETVHVTSAESVSPGKMAATESVSPDRTPAETLLDYFSTLFKILEVPGKVHITPAQPEIVHVTSAQSETVHVTSAQPETVLVVSAQPETVHVMPAEPVLSVLEPEPVAFVPDPSVTATLAIMATAMWCVWATHTLEPVVSFPEPVVSLNLLFH